LAKLEAATMTFPDISKICSPSSSETMN